MINAICALINAICALITGLVIIVFGAYILLFKNIATNKDIIIMLMLGFAYIGYSIGMISEKYKYRG